MVDGFLGVGGVVATGPAAVCGGGQLSLDGCLALFDDASTTHPNRPQHAAGSESPLKGEGGGQNILTGILLEHSRLKMVLHTLSLSLRNSYFIEQGYSKLIKY